MEDTISGELDKRTELKKMEREAMGIMDPTLSQVLRDFLAAVRCDDETLVQSTAISAYETFRLIARDIGRKLVDVSFDMQRRLQKVSSKVEGVVLDDEVMRSYLSGIDKLIAAMTMVRDEIVNPLGEIGFPVENHQELEQTINNLRQFRENLLKDWPDLERLPAPLNHQVIEEAKKSVAREEKWMTRKDLIHPKKTG